MNGVTGKTIEEANSFIEMVAERLRRAVENGQEFCWTAKNGVRTFPTPSGYEGAEPDGSCEFHLFVKLPNKEDVK